jgi:hypothetical protein
MEICPTQIVAGFLKGQKKLREGKLKKFFALSSRAKMLGDSKGPTITIAKSAKTGILRMTPSRQNVIFGHSQLSQECNA